MRIGVILAVLMLVSFSQADQIEKIVYDCKGNTKTFIGDREVEGMEQGSEFKVVFDGFTEGMHLKMGQDPNSPDIMVKPLSKDYIEIILKNVFPLYMRTSEDTNIIFGDSSLHIQPSRTGSYMVLMRTETEMLLSLSNGGFQAVIKHNDLITGSVHDGRIEFRTSDDKVLKCKINID